jgi:hypothetical protein
VIFFIVWLVLIVVLLAPAFPGYDLWFWVLVYFIPPLVLVPIVQAIT